MSNPGGRYAPKTNKNHKTHSGLQIFKKTFLIIFYLAALCLPTFATEKPKDSPKNWERILRGRAKKTKTVVELQRFRILSTAKIQTNTGMQGEAALINLNPHVNVWYLLVLKWEGVKKPDTYHLENRFPAKQTLLLKDEFPMGIVIQSLGEQDQFGLWQSIAKGPLSEARKSNALFAPVCDNRVYLRNKSRGRKTRLESAADFLRRSVPGGEKITTFIKGTFYKDKFASTSEVVRKPDSVPDEPGPGPNAPPSPLVNPKYENSYLVPESLGLPLDTKDPKRLLCGRWYPVKNKPGMFVGAIQPRMAAEEIIKSQKGRVKRLGKVGKSAMAYLTAFDLNMYEAGFSLGTDHPEVGWSTRVRPSMRNPKLPGPDGIATAAPLVRTGILRPDRANRVIATMAGGFKRYHGAFRSGPLGKRNYASHYGFVENGVVMSGLHPGLATFIVFTDGNVTMKTWEKKDEKLMPQILHARQNGAPIIEYDKKKKAVLPTMYVKNFYHGNWSGSAEGQLRTLRAGIALLEKEDRRFLVHGYFSTAMPSAMARIFQAYGCKYAMQTDMNALEHTYMAIYDRTGGAFKIYHLMKGMKVLDKVVKKKPIPRFIGFPDNRDFFYIMKKGD